MTARPWAVAGAVVLLAVGIAGPWLLWQGRRWGALLAVAIGTMLMVDCMEDAYERIAPRQSGLAVAEKIRPIAGPGSRIYSVGIYDQTVPFYIARTVTLVHYVDEFETGLKSQPGLAIPDLGQFRDEWLRPGEALAIIHPDIYQALRAQELPMQLVHEDPRRVLVRKP
jgi:hypothetical protein